MVASGVRSRLSRQGSKIPLLRKKTLTAGKSKNESAIYHASDVHVHQMLSSIFENKYQAKRRHPFYSDHNRGYNINVNLLTCTPYEFIAATVPFGGIESGNFPLLAERPVPQHEHIKRYIYDDDGDAIMRDLSNLPKTFKGHIFDDEGDSIMMSLNDAAEMKVWKNLLHLPSYLY